jgi:conjugal transfer/type IV secretion protein DotA/TraY
MGVTRTKMIKYILLPGLWPRAKALLTQGFFHISYLIALIYNAVGLLPTGHPYLNPQNRGRFGIRHVIAAAANNLRFTRQNLDQIFVFFVILIGLVLLILQLILFGAALFSEQYVLAQATPPEFPSAIRHVLFESWYYNPNNAAGPGTHQPGQEIALILLDKIFGTGGSSPDHLIFGSCISDATIACKDMDGNALPAEPYPYPIHTALHTLLEFYTRGIFMVAVIILIYFTVTMVAETAVSGTPFGQRTNKLWMPIRIITFFFLLIPLGSAHGSGLNMAQIITFRVAKLGTNFATNAWGYFTAEVFQADESFAGKKNKLIATPNIPEVNALLQFMYLAKVCKVASESMYMEALETGSNKYGHDGIKPYIVRPPGDYKLQPNAEEALELDITNFDQARKYTDYGNITIVFGAHNTHADAGTLYTKSPGNVYPICGQLNINVTSMGIKPNQLNAGSTQPPPLSGVGKIQEVYFDLIKNIWLDQGYDFTSPAKCEARRTLGVDYEPNCTPVLNATLMQSAAEHWHNALETDIHQLIEDEINDSDQWDVPDALRSRGWGGAGIWYNRIAQINGDITGAILAKPNAVKYPAVMEAVVEARRKESEGSAVDDMFNPALNEGVPVAYPMEQAEDHDIAVTLYGAFKKWQKDNILQDSFERNDGSSIIVRAIDFLFGAGSIYDMRENADIHPLAQLSALGKSMMEVSARNIAGGLIGTGANSLMKNDLGVFAKVFGSFLSTMGFATLGMSFVMFYILPMLPFIYFFFALAGWVKSIFEAVVAMPLWALAHVRIDGDGLSGQYANSGYFLLLEIFLRPVLIIFGLIASIIIFTSLIEVLNEIFSLVVASVSGFDMEAETNIPAGESLAQFFRGPVDQLMYTVIYVIIVFLIGQSCFKLIDLIPNQILRWAGNPVKTFQESAGDPAGDAMSMTYKGIQLGTSQIEGGALATFF